jgi:uncharacterized protein YoxC
MSCRVPFKRRVGSAETTGVEPSNMAMHRRGPLEDLSLSGSLMPPLWGLVGLTLAITGASNVDGGRWYLLGPGLACMGMAAGIWRLDWARVPAVFVRALPYLGILLLDASVLGAPRAYTTMAVVLTIAMVWSGFALERIDVALLSLMCAVSIFLPQWRQFPHATAVWHVLEIWLMVTTAGAVMHWLRSRLDEAAERVLHAQAEVADLQSQALVRDRQTEAQRAEQAAARLSEQAQLQQQIAGHAATLAGAAGDVSSNTDSAAAATEQMAQALRELTRTAQVTEGITSSVVRKADRAAAVIRALESSSAEIMAASDVIQAIAGQTNLLALNATIESARAGEAGRGFAVVATEVKDLARQSGENADSITRTLAEVQAQVADAVAEVTEITASMAELSSHHGTLAAAIEQQSAAVAEVSRSVQEAATEVTSMADGIRALEKISHSSR